MKQRGEYFIMGQTIQPLAGIEIEDIGQRTDHMTYLPGMEQIDSSIREAVLSAFAGYQPEAYTAQDVRQALNASIRTPWHFAALLSPAAEPLL